MKRVVCIYNLLGRRFAMTKIVSSTVIIIFTLTSTTFLESFCVYVFCCGEGGSNAFWQLCNPGKDNTGIIYHSYGPAINSVARRQSDEIHWRRHQT